MKFNELELNALMEYCISLAQKSPSGIRKPYVGAMIIDDHGKIVGREYKNFLDSGSGFIQHAERVALDDAAGLAEGATLVTTLEPCVRPDKKTVFKPCSELIIERGIRRVILGLRDDSPTVKIMLALIIY